MAARKFSPKDKDEVLDYSVDWSRLLGTDTISTFEWKIHEDEGNSDFPISAGETVLDLQLEQASNTNTVVTARFGLGKNNKTYKLICSVTTATGLTFARTILLPIKEK